MSEVFLKLLNMSITASWLILAIVIIRPLLKKAPKWINCVLWALVAIRLVCPFSFESALSLIPSSETIHYDIAMQNAPTIETGISSVNQVINPIIADSFTSDPLNSANPLQILIPVASIVWLMGMVLLLLYALISYLRLKKSVGASIVLKDDIMVCDEVKSPFILGIIKPVVYVPSSMTGETLSCVLNHEMAHIRRRDHWWKPLGFLLLSVYWFNPVCWLACILLCRDIEMACDEKVIRDMDRDEKAAYSQALLNCNFPRKKIAACPLAFGEISVKDRVKSVLNYKKPAFWIIVVAVIACVAVAVCFMTNPKDNEPDLSFLNYENACSLAADVINVDAIYYPPTNKNEDGIISIGYVNGNELAKYLDNVSWQKWNAPQEGLSSPGSIEFCISDDYRITIYQKPRWAVVTYGDEVRYYKTHGGDYEDAVKLFYTGTANKSNVMQATVMEIENGTMLVKPVEGAWELNSADLFRIPIKNMEASPEPRVGDMIEVEYNGGILETYPASFENIFYISVVEQRDVGYDICPCVKVNGTLYFDTGYESSVTGRCGNMDGTIDSECAGSEIPKIDNQGNFGTGYGYQYGPLEGTIEILINEEWRVFATEEVKATYRGAISQPDIAAILETVTIDYGTSSNYTVDDMNAAIAVIVNTFSTFEGCELHSLTYGSDDQSNSAENIAWMNDLETANDNQQVFTECIMFESSFRSPKNGGGAWNANEEYTWSWWLARGEGSGWKLMTWGY